MEEFQNQIGYHFISSNLLREALHPAGTASPHANKRLVFDGNTTDTFDTASGACVQSTNLK
ncbi:unnamed protein product [Penicillium salamii]|uniref:Uncharacterized protein n=1 Tax=Penicillium salamii TaxID=1612424 RepID=A0A9W4IL34_9EURO|nr:unnamed protein product [Penicillium salamii]CAG8231703.1 unnamed protein product [Penicillium salamii]CAG8296556.1 unnamed protein product [Penicillium salamii]